ncbi:MAG: transmembrane anchor protein [Rhodocyclaceae bacterium]|nr:transmembrane anchor protein [Rhodocyclaceae bacterium]
MPKRLLQGRRVSRRACGFEGQRLHPSEQTDMSAVLVLFWHPSEYGIDPTGVGGLTGLTERGEIKQQLAAAASSAALSTLAPVAKAPASDPVEAAAAEAVAPEWRDEISHTLAPGEGVELKLVMEEGQVARFAWTANGGVVDYNTHADGGGQSISYEQGRVVPEQAGELVAAFTGNHGWFWRNRTDAPVTLTLRTAGEYAELRAP